MLMRLPSRSPALAIPLRRPLACVLVLLLTACSQGLPRIQDLDTMKAITDTEATDLGRFVERVSEGKGEKESGFYLLPQGLEAFLARMVLIEKAERSLDLQYYIFHGDTSGKLIAGRLLQAAERGVRIRLLLDDLGGKPKDAPLAALNAHPNVNLRLFNPVVKRKGMRRLFEMAGSFGRINHRMHNKLLVADNQVMITGGRNVGDEYFAYGGVDFQDIDVLGAGPISAEGSESFDTFWNSEYAIPLELLVDVKNPEASLRELRELLERFTEEQRDSDYIQSVRESLLARQIREGDIPLTWAESRVYHDVPGKVGAREEMGKEMYLGRHLKGFALSADEQVLISSAYFVPGASGLELFTSLENRGVEVKVLTNSLASTDVPIVHSGYAKYRKPLLEAGVEMWELRLSAAQKERTAWFRGSSQASLHAKTIVFDQDAVFVGTINLDPRSVVQNTEVGVLILSPELSEQVTQLFRRWVKPDYAYRVELDETGKALQWVAEENGEKVVLDHEPDASMWLRFKTWLLGLLPIESQI